LDTHEPGHIDLDVLHASSLASSLAISLQRENGALLPDTTVTDISRLGDLAAVEDVVAEILHLEDGGVGTSGRGLVEMRLDHLADHDVMVALLDDAGDAALHGARCLDQQRRAGRALAIGLPAQLAILDVDRPEEGEGEALLLLAQHVEREGARRLDDLVGAV